MHRLKMHRRMMDHPRKATTDVIAPRFISGGAAAIKKDFEDLHIGDPPEERFKESKRKPLPKTKLKFKF